MTPDYHFTIQEAGWRPGHPSVAWYKVGTKYGVIYFECPNRCPDIRELEHMVCMMIDQRFEKTKATLKKHLKIIGI